MALARGCCSQYLQDLKSDADGYMPVSEGWASCVGWPYNVTFLLVKQQFLPKLIPHQAMSMANCICSYKSGWQSCAMGASKYSSTSHAYFGLPCMHFNVRTHHKKQFEDHKMCKPLGNSLLSSHSSLKV